MATLFFSSLYLPSSSIKYGVSIAIRITVALDIKLYTSSRSLFTVEVKYSPGKSRILSLTDSERPTNPKPNKNSDIVLEAGRLEAFFLATASTSIV